MLLADSQPRSSSRIACGKTDAGVESSADLGVLCMDGEDDGRAGMCGVWLGMVEAESVRPPAVCCDRLRPIATDCDRLRPTATGGGLLQPAAASARDAAGAAQGSPAWGGGGFRADLA